MTKVPHPIVPAHGRRGKVLVFDGADGVGKTRLARIFEVWAMSAYVPVVWARYDDTVIASTITREILRRDLPRPSALAAVHAFAAAWQEEVERIIIPALDLGAFVILDRSEWSTPAINAAAAVEEIDLSTLDSLFWDTTRLIPADLTIELRGRASRTRNQLSRRHDKHDWVDAAGSQVHSDINRNLQKLAPIHSLHVEKVNLDDLRGAAAIVAGHVQRWLGLALPEDRLDDAMRAAYDDEHTKRRVPPGTLEKLHFPMIRAPLPVNSDIFSRGGPGDAFRLNVEGLDGAGKSTQLGILALVMKTTGYEVHISSATSKSEPVIHGHEIRRRLAILSEGTSAPPSHDVATTRTIWLEVSAGIARARKVAQLREVGIQPDDLNCPPYLEYVRKHVSGLSRAIENRYIIIDGSQSIHDVAQDIVRAIGVPLQPIPFVMLMAKKGPTTELVRHEAWYPPIAIETRLAPDRVPISVAAEPMVREPPPPLLRLAVEGLPGCGKSTQLEFLALLLKHSGYETHIVGTDSTDRGRLITRAALDDPDASALTQFHAVWSAIRLTEREVVEPLIRAADATHQRIAILYEGGADWPYNIAESRGENSRQLEARIDGFSPFPKALKIWLEVPFKRAILNSVSQNDDRGGGAQEMRKLHLCGLRRAVEGEHVIIPGADSRELVAQDIAHAVERATGISLTPIAEILLHTLRSHDLDGGLA